MTCSHMNNLYADTPNWSDFIYEWTVGYTPTCTFYGVRWSRNSLLSRGIFRKYLVDAPNIEISLNLMNELSLELLWNSAYNGLLTLMYYKI